MIQIFFCDLEKIFDRDSIQNKYMHVCMYTTYNATLGTFTSSGQRELTERGELLLKIDFSVVVKILKQALSIKYGSQFIIASLKC